VVTGHASSPAATSAPPSNFALLIHCGIKFAVFDGAAWEALPPVPFISDTVQDKATGNFHSRYEVRGLMSRTSDTQARFVCAEDPVGAIVNFRRTAETPAPCA